MLTSIALDFKGESAHTWAVGEIDSILDTRGERVHKVRNETHLPYLSVMHFDDNGDANRCQQSLHTNDNNDATCDTHTHKILCIE